jgi:hypothetical protein
VSAGPTARVGAESAGYVGAESAGYVGAESAGYVGANRRRIFVVFKTHFDLGFTGLVSEVIESYVQQMIPRALDACRRTASLGAGHAFTWTLPGWPLTQALQKLAGTPVGAELEKMTAAGRIAWHALPFTTHTELFGLEDFIRGLYVGRALRERFGRAPIAAKMTDVPGHTWILPTVLAAAGVRFLHLGCNACSTPPDVPFLFRWEGPDGSRVVTMYSPGGYGTGLFPPQGWTLPVWLALQHTSDNAGPQQADAVQEILRTVAERSPETEVVVGTLDDFARALEELDPDLPVVRSDLADSWIHGIGSMPAEVGRLRAVRNRLVSVESMLSLRGLLGAAPAAEDIRTRIAAAYESILVFGEHTWGMDTKLALNPPEFGGRVYDKASFEAVLRSGLYDRIRKSWDDKSSLVGEAEGHVQAAEGEIPPATTSGTLEVSNHHLWEWNGWTKIGSSEGEVIVTRGSDASPMPLRRRHGLVWVNLRGLPPLSLTRLNVGAAPAPAPAPRRAPHARREKASAKAFQRRMVLDNGMIRVDVDRTGGGITGIIDARSGRNWVDATKGPFGAYRYDVFSRREITAYLKSYAYDLEPWFLDDFGKPGYSQGEHRTFTGVLADSVAEQGEGWAEARLTWRQDTESVRGFGNAADVVQAISLSDDSPWVDMTFTIRVKDPCPLLEAGHAVFPFAARRPRYALNKTGSVIDPATGIARNANRLLFCCERWVDVEDSGGGMLVVPLDSPLFSIGSPAIERFEGESRPGLPVLFFNLFNTQWGTNFPQWISGPLEYRFRFIPHEGTWRSAKAWELAAAAVQPPACRSAAGNADSVSLLKGPVRGLETVTLKPCEDDGGWILRMRDPTGRGGRRRLDFRLPDDSRQFRVMRCSLLEDEQEQLPTARAADSLRLEISVRPFEIVTLKLVGIWTGAGGPAPGSPQS